MALAVEEGMIRNIANRVISDGIGAFDRHQPSTSSSATSRPRADHPPSVRIANESIVGTAIAAIATAMANHRGIRTRPSTMSTDNPGRSAN